MKDYTFIMRHADGTIKGENFIAENINEAVSNALVIAKEEKAQLYVPFPFPTS